MNFLEDYAPALFGLLGTIVGGLGSFVGSWLLGKREFDLRSWNQILDRRIQAHEYVISIAMDLRISAGLGGVDEDGEPLRTPKLMLSKVEFEEFFARVTAGSAPHTTWLSIDALREMNYLQDYLVTMYQNLFGVGSGAYPAVGVVVRQDFVDISGSLERVAYKYFQADVRKLKLRDLDEWHKYPRSKTEARLKTSRFLTKWKQIDEIVGPHRSSNT